MGIIKSLGLFVGCFALTSILICVIPFAWLFIGAGVGVAAYKMKCSIPMVMFYTLFSTFLPPIGVFLFVNRLMSGYRGLIVEPVK